MAGYVRSSCVAGIAVLAAGAVAFTPSITPTPPDITVPAVSLSAAQSPSPELARWLQELQESASRAAAPAITAPTVTTNALLVLGPAPLNAASDAILNTWNAVLPWIDYGVNLVDGALGWIPGLAIVGNQISIVYYSLVRPVADSFVVDLVVPVVNDPLNINSYINGLSALGTVTVNSLINLGVNEFNYFFGWLIPPIGATAGGPAGTLSGINTIPALVQRTLTATGPAVDLVATGVTTTVSATERATQDVVTGVRSLSSAVQRTATDVDTAVADVTATATERVRSVIDRHVDQDTEIATKTTVNGLVSAQGAVRSSAATAATDLGGGAQTHKPGRVVKDAPKAPGVGGISDTGNEAVKGAQQTGRNVGDAVKAAHSSDDE